jgi:PAS domain S-box-containing protein
MAPPLAWEIVLIDDEQDIRDVMTITLEDAGCNVSAAPNGEMGLQLCDEVSPQIVITDIRMPGMDGIQVLESLKKMHPDIEVIVATAFGDMDLAIRALQLDASDFITKPINNEALHLALKRAQERYTARKQLADYTALLERERDLTSRELVKTFVFQKNLIESSMDGILACDRDDTVIAYNTSMEQMLGYTKNTVIRYMRFEQFFQPEEDKRFKEELAGEKFGGKNRLYLYETTLLGQSGQKIPVQLSANVLFSDGKEDGFVCFTRDLRELRKLEREVQDQARILHQDKMMSLGKLAASVVHEINNPLSGILNYLRLMLQILRRGPLSEKRREKFKGYLELVETETERCSSIVSSLLTFSRKSPLAFEPVKINDLIERCTILSQHKLELSNIRLEVASDPDLPPVEGDFNQLQQCIINLIFNAIDAMPQGGKLYLEGHYHSDTNQVSITVKDTGPGILPEDLPHIFEPFYTTKKEGYGAGLGLSTVYGIVEHHKGTIDVDSRPGEGAAFIIQLPSG